jgi:regulator of sigma E protease
MLVDSGVRAAFSERIPFVADSLIPNSNALAAGLMVNDSIVGVGRYFSPYFQDIQRQIATNKGKTVALHVVRDGQNVEIPVAINAKGTIGVYPKSVSTYLDVDTLHYTVGQAIPGGFKQAWGTITDYGSQLKFIFSKSGATQIGGFATFAKLFPEKWDWWAFWSRTALISLILAFMNILPIPALDGGHVMFLLWEMATGKAPNQKVMEYSQMAGMILLLGLMLYGNGMDIFRAVMGQ